MFRSIDDPIATIETKISIPVRLYLKYRCSAWLAAPLRGRGVGTSFGFVAAVAEEVAEEGGGVFCEEAILNDDGVVEAGIGRGVMEATGVAGFGIGGSEDQAREAGGVGGAGAHGAWF
jgi:hypothetical protein